MTHNLGSVKYISSLTPPILHKARRGRPKDVKKLTQVTQPVTDPPGTGTQAACFWGVESHHHGAYNSVPHTRKGTKKRIIQMKMNALRDMNRVWGRGPWGWVLEILQRVVREVFFEESDIYWAKWDHVFVKGKSGRPANKCFPSFLLFTEINFCQNVLDPAWPLTALGPPKRPPSGRGHGPS